MTVVTESFMVCWYGFYKHSIMIMVFSIASCFAALFCKGKTDYACVVLSTTRVYYNTLYSIHV